MESKNEDVKTSGRSNTKIRAIYASVGLFVVLVAVGVGIQIAVGKLSWGGYLAMSAFYALMFYLGLAASKQKSQSVQDLLLAGRSLPLSVALLTMTATWVGGGFINGTAESVMRDGIVWAQAPWGYTLSLIIGGLLFARPMRRRNYTTMLDPLEDRYGKPMAGVLFLPAMMGEIFWTAAILTALGTTFGLILNIDFDLSIILSALVAIIYTSFGGMRAVAMTDVFQLAILIVGLYLALPFVLPESGLNGLWSDYHAKMGGAAYPWPTFEDPQSHFLWWDFALLLIFGGIPWHVYFQRVLSSRDESTAQWLSIGAGGLCVVAAAPAVVIGMIAATTDWTSLQLDGPESASVALPYVLQNLAPPLIATIGLGALAAAVMSSVDSSILSASSMGSWNVYRPLFCKDENALHLNRVVRSMIWIVGIAALLLALQIKSVYALWFLCSDFVYCILFAQLLTALFVRHANAIGSLSGFIVAATLRLGGGESALGLPQWIPYPMVGEDGTVYFPFRTTSMLAGLITIIVVSRLTAKYSSPRQLVSRQN